MATTLPGNPAQQSKRTRRKEDDELDELEVERDVDADLEEFLEDNDATPGDRRRDPLRRGA